MGDDQVFATLWPGEKLNRQVLKSSRNPAADVLKPPDLFVLQVTNHGTITYPACLSCQLQLYWLNQPDFEQRKFPPVITRV